MDCYGAAVPASNAPFGWRFVAPLVVAASLNPINISILATALVPISQGLGVSAGRTAVLVAAVYLATAIGQPTMGKLGSHFGHRRILVVGMVVTIAGGILGGVAQSLEVLFISRVVVGLGTSAGYPTRWR